MNPFTLLFLVAILPAPLLAAGRIEGRVVLEGTPPPEIAIRMGPDCAALWPEPPATRHYLVGKDKGLAQVVVVIREGVDARKFQPPTNVVMLECVACQLEPYVVAVQVGQTLRFTNASPLIDNVHLTPRKNPEAEVNFGMLRGCVRDIVFKQPEDFIRITTDVSPWLFSYVFVLEHPFFALTDRDGKFSLPEGLPDGTYKLEVLHRRAGSSTRSVTIRDGHAEPVQFTLQVPRR